MLEEYRRKRDFSKSPEPAGDQRGKRRAHGRLFFCVQKHLASHLHYDFRLEWNGVLLSWAVPKGPSLDSAIKRLAMHVEDHPIDYGEFEGVIPAGYGAGIVMLWDRGTWTPEVDDVDAALRKGDLKFTLEGYKLKGSWALIRTSGGYGRRSGSGGSDRESSRSWLLIKHKDDWSGAVDIIEFAPLSVKSGGDFADILASENPDIWLSNRPANSGEAGALFERIIQRALDMKAARETGARPAPRAATGAARSARKVTASKKPVARSPKASTRSRTRTAGQQPAKKRSAGR